MLRLCVGRGETTWMPRICLSSVCWEILGVFAKLQNATVSVFVSVHLSADVWHNLAPTGRIFMKFDDWIFFFFLKICYKNWSFIKIWQEEQLLYMKAYVHLWEYLAEFVLEWEVSETEVIEKNKIHILCSVTFMPLWDNMGKYCRAAQATDDNVIWRMCLAWWIMKATNIHSECVILLAFPHQCSVCRVT